MWFNCQNPAFTHFWGSVNGDNKGNWLSHLLKWDLKIGALLIGRSACCSASFMTFLSSENDPLLVNFSVDMRHEFNDFSLMVKIVLYWLPFLLTCAMNFIMFFYSFTPPLPVSLYISVILAGSGPVIRICFTVTGLYPLAQLSTTAWDNQWVANYC